jgi:hypothetical protein
VQPEVWRECLDVFDLEGARQFWPQHFDKLEKLELLRRHNIPESVELPSREEKSFAFENVTLDIVDAFVASDHQVSCKSDRTKQRRLNSGPFNIFNIHFKIIQKTFLRHQDIVLVLS